MGKEFTSNNLISVVCKAVIIDNIGINRRQPSRGAVRKGDVMKILLVGGFLGSGKTSFILKLAHHMIEDLGIANIVILENEIGEISSVTSEKSIDTSAISRSIRLDVYVKDGQGRIYDIEMQILTTSRRMWKTLWGSTARSSASPMPSAGRDCSGQWIICSAIS